MSFDKQHVMGAFERLVRSLDKLSPIETRDTPDYAELTFGEHQTQAMTMQPADWNEVAEAYHAARTALEASSRQEERLRLALESAIRALDTDSTPIVRRLARIQIRNALEGCS